MSLLNDALRKKNSGRQKSEKNHLIRKKSSRQSLKKTRHFRMTVLLFFVGVTAAFAWYMVNSLSAGHHATFDSALVRPTVQPTAAAANNTDSEEAFDLDLVLPHPTEQTKADILQEAPEPVQRSSALVPRKTEIRPLDETTVEPKKTVNTLKRKIPEATLKFPRSSPAPEEKHFFQKALRYHRQGKFNLAIQMYHLVLKVNPDHLDALLNLSSAYIQIKAYSEAYPKLNKLRTLDAYNPDVLLNLAITEIGLGRPAEAMKLLDQASIQFDQPIFGIHFHRAAALSRLNRLKEAHASYKRAEELNPEHSALLFNLAVLSDKLKRYDEAVSYYKKYLYMHTGLTDNEMREIRARISSLQLYLAQM